MAADPNDPRGPDQPLAVLWQRKALIAALVGGATGLAALALAVVEPRYTAEALVALNTRTSTSAQLLTSKPNVTAPPLAAAVVSTEIDILRSRAMTESVVEALALDRDPEFNRRLEPSVLPEPVAGWWRDLKDTLVDAPGDDRVAAVEAVAKRLEVKSDADSFAIRISFGSREAGKAALIANAYADLYIRSQREARLADMRIATDWITGQIDRLQGDLTREAADAVALRRKHKLAPAELREQGVVAGQQMVALTTELAMAERERAEAEASLAQARRWQKGGGSAASLTFAEDSPFLQEMRREEAKILGRVAELSVGYREDSPAMAAMQGQLATLRAEIDREMSAQIERIANRAAQAKAREDVLRRRLDRISGRSAASDAATSEVGQREKVIEAKNLMLESFLGRYAELTNRAEILDSDARIASRATAPSRPSHPKPLLFLGVAFTGSFGLAVSLAFLLERFRAGFLSTRQVREALGLATLGILPDTGAATPKVRPGDYLVDRPESVYAEAVRSAQIAITNARGEGAGPVMVTSSVPGEGKTAFAVSLGRSLALSEKRVLLVDCDLRRPSVARQLDAYEVPGLSDFARQQASLEEVVRHDPRSGLDFIAAGGHTAEPQRVLEDPAVAAALKTLAARYDWVLVDTPPTMVASDAALLTGRCGMALYVVEWDKTPRRAVEAGIEHLRAFDIIIGGVVLTKVDLDRQRQYSDYVDFCFRSSEYYGN
ncbi:Wzz/FepE/Etk N-terminal domain-containing protein [Magnetospirillum sp. UT-4]|uniref:Wzz/FepE/Etk N-terminal domain-containing protein n=1 Tax=Magnetospirillum sp. UT-4 TaxID=2681467 RepID=UPI0013827880|nr:Wzz/FepE/Etk N-terminal domain-containing protein [Magnetospirillum sp. UT-4]CAA7625488.1 putative Succinoglycan biosynthesis transport protein exoP [Magnetospirillum sp. UT-4]